VNVLLDECVPARLARLLTAHSVTTVPKCGWAGINNGDLLKLAEKEYDVFVTMDRKLSLQQEFAEFDIAVLLIRAQSNRLEDIRPLVPQLLEALEHATRRSLTTASTA
jgi:predicted nuclease of predicted toxin-antitoxin system